VGFELSFSRSCVVHSSCEVVLTACFGERAWLHLIIISHAARTVAMKRVARYGLMTLWPLGAESCATRLGEALAQNAAGSSFFGAELGSRNDRG
jgi:hypothetical protein